MLSKEDREYLLQLARKSIKDYFEGKETTSDRKFGKKGVFVTLNEDGRLRGCIGFVSPIYDLSEGVIKAARAAAFGDPRFPPLSKEELDKIKIEISVLSEPRPIKPEDVIIGKHGLIIEYNGYSGLLLPQVAVEWNMNREEFLDAVCEKAGLPPGFWKSKGVKLYAFEAEVFGEG